jgi:DNA-directed RNA polymerase specialized sigma24 family protein
LKKSLTAADQNALFLVETMNRCPENAVSPARHPDLVEEQRALMARIEDTTRWLVRALNHQSSKNTEDFRDIACEKLLRSDEYGPILREEPRRLMGMVPRMMRRILADDARRADAQRRPPRTHAVDIQEHPVAVDALAEAAMVNGRRLARLEHELDAFERGETSGRTRPDRRAPMVRAFRLKQQGWTDARIAEALGVSKPAVNAWLKTLTAHLAVRLARWEQA